MHRNVNVNFGSALRHVIASIRLCSIGHGAHRNRFRQSRFHHTRKQTLYIFIILYQSSLARAIITQLQLYYVTMKCALTEGNVTLCRTAYSRNIACHVELSSALLSIFVELHISDVLNFKSNLLKPV